MYEYVENMKAYVGNMKGYVGNMKEYVMQSSREVPPYELQALPVNPQQQLLKVRVFGEVPGEAPSEASCELSLFCLLTGLYKDLEEFRAPIQRHET